MHQFHAIAFEENLSLRQLTGVFAGARISVQELYLPIESHWRHLRISVRCDGDLRRTAGTHGLQKRQEKILRVANSAEALGNTCLPEVSP